MGPDIFSKRMLLAVRNEISKTLYFFFNKSLHDRVFTDQLKVAYVIHLFKSGDKSLPSDYSLVSLLSCVSKWLENIIYKNIFNHLHENKLLYNYQPGFILGYFTMHQLIELYIKSFLALNDKLVTSIAFADIIKAFDTVWIKTLLYKKTDIKESLLCWLKSHLCSRSQKIVLKYSLLKFGN